MNSAWQLNNQMKGTTVRLMGGIDFIVPKINQPRKTWKTIDDPFTPKLRLSLEKDRCTLYSTLSLSHNAFGKVMYSPCLPTTQFIPSSFVAAHETLDVAAIINE